MLNPWRHPRIADVIQRISTSLRRRRVETFIMRFSPDPWDCVLDVGALPYQRRKGQLGAINPLMKHYPWPNRVLSVGIETNWELPLSAPYIAGDGCRLPLRDASVDFVFSNAVIEHVGGPGRAASFVNECWRVARKGIWISTPNRAFPIEIHTFLPFVHWLPLAWYWWVAARLYHRHFAQPQAHWPLGRRDLQHFLPAGCAVSGSGGPWPVQLVIWGRKNPESAASSGEVI